MTEQTPQTESRSSVKITTNAKGEAQVEVKVYAIDEDVAAASYAATRTLADTFDELRRSGVQIAGKAA